MPQPPRPPPTPRCRARRAVGLGLLLVLATAGWGRPARASGTSDTTAGFKRFVSAWTTRSTKAVVYSMEQDGKVSLRLYGYPLSGRARIMGAEQATETLKTYFRKITAVSLKDITPRRSPRNVRLYTYQYKATGENARTTLLQVQLKLDKNRLWVLASVTESVKPRG